MRHTQSRHPLLLVLLLLLGGGCAVFFGPAQRPAPLLQVEATPERVERGRYLATHVAVCVHCHSRRDFTRFSMAVQPGSEGAGGDCLDEKAGMPGRICGSNLTPDVQTGLGGWTDGEVLRAMREGVSRTGRALVPMMPYKGFRHLSDEDALAIVAWLRTLPARRNAVPPSVLHFPLGGLVRLFPRPLEGPVAAPPREDTVAYGRYLVELADCRTCHTPKRNNLDVEELAFAGGFRLRMEGVADVVSPNITPDAQTGIGDMSREEFIGRFKAFSGPDAAFPVTPAQQTFMPWTDYAGMTEEDLGAIYDYLRTVRPVRHQVGPRG